MAASVSLEFQFERVTSRGMPAESDYILPHANVLEPYLVCPGQNFDLIYTDGVIDRLPVYR
jgi:hypothetical protein